MEHQSVKRFYKSVFRLRKDDVVIVDKITRGNAYNDF